MWTTIDTLLPAGELIFLFPAKPEWDHHVHVFVVRQWQGEAREAEEIRPEWFALESIAYSQMWDDAAHWLPRVLKRCFFFFFFDTFNHSYSSSTTRQPIRGVVPHLLNRESNRCKPLRSHFLSLPCLALPLPMSQKRARDSPTLARLRKGKMSSPAGSNTSKSSTSRSPPPARAQSPLRRSRQPRSCRRKPQFPSPSHALQPQ